GAAARPSAPARSGYEGTAAWLDAIGEACGVARPTVEAAKNKLLPPIKAALANARINGRITMFGYEGSELLVARLMVESGADLRYVGTACPRTPWSEADRDWLESRGVRVQFRATHEQDLAAIVEFRPDLAIGTTPMVQKAKELSIPSIYFTNLISTLPMFGAAGAGSLARLINAAINNKARFDRMSAFFAGIGEAEEDDRPEFREAYQRRLAAQAKQRKALEVG
ncbi:MAG: chlorophyllide reductase subunit Y, partial [Methylacidiphilales bacterium]|nr:chlorophyllide reductase subunit Y [Candidatus Methylacidiphilales bacterium]